MKKILETEKYIFNPILNQIIFIDKSIKLERILLITNITEKQIIYNFADINLTGTFNNYILTFSYNVTEMSSTDILQIIYWSDNEIPIYTEGKFSEVLFRDNTTHNLLFQIISELKFLNLMISNMTDNDIKYTDLG